MQVDTEATQRAQEQQEKVNAEVKQMHQRLEAEVGAHAEAEARQKIEQEEEHYATREACGALGLEFPVETPPLVNDSL